MECPTQGIFKVRISKQNFRNIDYSKKNFFSELHTVITKHLIYHLNNTSIQRYKSQTFRHYCSILCVISNFTTPQAIQLNLLQDCLCKWLTQLSTLNNFQVSNLNNMNYEKNFISR